MPHLFEFTDQPWVAASARETFFEILDLCNSNVRSFNSVVADEVIRMKESAGITGVVELGAGRAPITTYLAADKRSQGLRLIPCDLVPAKEIYQDLATRYPGKVRPILEPLDFTKAHDWESDTLLVFCTSLHHLPPSKRREAIQSITVDNVQVAVFEPMRRTLLSILLVTLALVPALLLPIAYLGRPGRLRRIFWCWLFPAVPLMFVWDAIVSCLRQWTVRQWNRELETLVGEEREPKIRAGNHSLVVIW